MNESLADRIFSIATAPYSGNPDVQCDMSLALDAICDEVRALVEEITELKTIHKGYRKRMMSEIVELKSEITEQKDWNKKFIDMPNAEIEELKAENAELKRKKWTHCPECGCREFTHVNSLGKGFRICAKCEQEWWTDINYKEIHTKEKCDELKSQLTEAQSLIERYQRGDLVV